MNVRSIKRAKFGGKYFKVSFAKIKGGKFGLSSARSNPNKTIEINLEHKDHSNGEELLDTTLHECIHCLRPELAEDVVIEMAGDISNFLWRMGWRLPR